MRLLLQGPAPAPTGPTNGFSVSAWNMQAIDIKSIVLYVGLSIGVLVVGLLLTCLLICYWLRPRRHQRQVQENRTSRLEEVRMEEEDFKPQVRQFPILVMQPGMDAVMYANTDEELVGWTEEKFDAEVLSNAMSVDSNRHSSHQELPSCPSQPSFASMALFTPRSSAASVDLLESGASRSGNSSLPQFAPRDSAASTDLLLGSPGTSGHPSSSRSNVQLPTVDDNGTILASSSSQAHQEDFMAYNPLTHFLTDRHPRLFTAEVVYHENELFTWVPPSK